MNLEKQRAFIIHFIYFTILILCLFLFFRYVIYSLLPFILGFSIAFTLQPLITLIHKNTSLTKKISSIIVFLSFYLICTFLLGLLLIKAYSFLTSFLRALPTLYHTQCAPLLSNLVRLIESKFTLINPYFTVSFEALLTPLSSFVTSLSSTILTFMSYMVTSFPNVLIAFTFTFLSSLFFTLDYQNITRFILRQFPKHIAHLILNIKASFVESLTSLSLAYLKLMLLTFIGLGIGFLYLKIENAILLAFIIAFLDFLPLIGTGAIMIPWILYTYLLNQPKLAIGLLILHLIITVIHNLIEPKFIGKEVGLHPLLMLLSMYLGAKLFGILGFILLPNLMTFLIVLNKNKIINLYQ